MRVAAVQTTAGPDPAVNRERAGELVAEAAGAGARLVVLPEYVTVAGSPDHLRAHAEELDGPTRAWAAHLAASLGIWLVAGTFPERRPGTDRLANTSCLLAPDGTLAAVYRKIHLFDVDVPGARSHESATIEPGDELVTAPLGDGVVLGMTVCYDLRFPEPYRILALRGATVVCVPSAFTAVTGPPHWELLLRARAVEDQVVVVAAGQVGELPPGMPPCHGHSMVVDAWGTVVAERTEPFPGVVVADADPGAVAEIRRRLPVLAHRRPGAYRWPDGDGAGHDGRA